MVFTALAQEAPLAERELMGSPLKEVTLPPEVLAIALDAAQKMGEQTLRGECEAVVQKMYPRSQERTAKKLGGEENLATQMRELFNKISAQLIMMIKFQAKAALRAFEIPEFNE